MCDVSQTYCMGGKLLEAARNFHQEVKYVCKLEESRVKVGLWQGCVMSWLYNLFVGEVVK